MLQRGNQVHGTMLREFEKESSELLRFRTRGVTVWTEIEERQFSIRASIRVALVKPGYIKQNHNRKEKDRGERRHLVFTKSVGGVREGGPKEGL